jgi:hypothetical protein
MTIALLLLALITTPPEGSVIFISNVARPAGKVIARVTESDLTHAAIILYDNGKPYVYESTVPHVRRMTLEEYYARFKLKPNSKYCIAEPKTAFTEKEIQLMKAFADNQLGRPYSIRGYTKMHPVKGVHCSQFVTEVLSQSGRAESSNPGRVAPINLFKSLEPHYNFSPWTSCGPDEEVTISRQPQR